MKLMKVPLKSYGEFFKGAYSIKKKQTTVAQPLDITFWKYQKIPVKGVEDGTIYLHSEQLMNKYSLHFGKLDCYQTVIDFLMEEDNKNKEISDTGTPIRFSYIDTRGIAIQRNIDKLINNNKF